MIEIALSFLVLSIVGSFAIDCLGGLVRLIGAAGSSRSRAY
jgi:hypothetical protein